MSKNVMLNNVQNLITSLKLTIEKLNSIISIDKSYSKEQLDKQIILLQVKLQDDDNYKIVSNKSNSLEILIKKVQSERNTLKRLVGETDFRTSFLNQQIDKNNSVLSYEQREIEALANSLNIADNDEKIYSIIKQKRAKIDELKSDINSKLEQININEEDILFYKKKISDLDIKEEEYLKEFSSIPKLVIDENKKGKDINRLNRFLTIKDFVDKIFMLEEIISKLKSIENDLKNTRADINVINQEIDSLKEQISKINREISFFVKSIDIEELKNEKNIINERIISKNGYVLSDNERELIYDEIANLQLSILAEDGESLLDDNILVGYNFNVDKLKREIDIKNLECDLLANMINELMSKKTYFFREYTQAQIDDIDKEIRKKEKQLDSIKKVIEKYVKSKTDIENVISFIKKKKKSSDLLKESKKADLRNIKEFSFSRPTSKFNLNEDKQELIYIDFVGYLIEFANYLLGQNYVKRLDEITIDNIDTFVSVVGFYKYENLDVLYSDEFITKARMTMEEKLNNEVTKPEDFIDTLNSQGLTVVKFGKSLKSMEETKEIDKSVRLSA